MFCAFCRQQLGYVHGHAACLRNVCPMFGLNQAECCAGDQGTCVPTSAVAVAPATVSIDRASRDEPKSH